MTNTWKNNKKEMHIKDKMANKYSRSGKNTRQSCFSRSKAWNMIASSWCLTIPLIGQCLAPNSNLSVRRFAIFSELDFSAGLSSSKESSLGDKYKFRPSELLARSMIDEIIPIDLEQISGISELQAKMCEIASNGTLAFAFIAKEETIKYAQVVSETLGIPLLAVALESGGEKKIKAVQKGLTGRMEAKMTVDIGQEIIGERYIDSLEQIAAFVKYQKFPKIIVIYNENYSLQDFNSFHRVLGDQAQSASFVRIGSAEKNKLAFEHINSAFRELSLNQEQFNSELIAIVFGDGDYMENFINQIAKNVDEIHQTRFRVLLCFDEKSGNDSKRDFGNLFSGHMVSVVAPAEILSKNEVGKNLQNRQNGPIAEIFSKISALIGNSLRLLRDEKGFIDDKEVLPASINCAPRNQTMWTQGALIRDAVKELISRFPAEKEPECEKWRQIAASQMQLCSRKISTQDISCLSISDEIYNSCIGKTPPDFGKMRLTGFTGQNLTYKVVTVVDEPFVIKTIKQDGTIEWSGFSIDLLKILAKKINFQYEIFEGTAYGSLQKGENGSMVWSGMIGDIVSGRADFAVSAMTVTPQREKVVDFTKRYMDYAVGIVMKKKPAVSNLFSFLNPFHKTVWYSIIAGLIVVSLLLYVLNRISPKRIRGPQFHDSSLHGIFWFVYSSLVQQSTDMYLVTMSSQIVIGVWWFFILIIVSSYTANLAAFLTVTQMEKSIASFQDLADQTEMGFGTVGNTSIYDYLKFKSELDNELNSFWSKLWKGVNASQIADANDGFRRVTDSGRKFAFLWDVPIIEYKILNDPDCSLTTVQSSIFEKGYGIAVRRGHPIRDFMSMEILELQDKGDLVKLKNEWWHKTGSCSLEPDGPKKRKGEFTLENFAGAFCVLAVGLILACVVAACEIWSFIRSGKSYPPKTREISKTNSVADADRLRADEFIRNLEVKRYGNNDVHIVLKNAATAAIQSPSKEDEYTSFSRNSSLRRAYRQNSS